MTTMKQEQNRIVVRLAVTALALFASVGIPSSAAQDKPDAKEVQAIADALSSQQGLEGL